MGNEKGVQQGNPLSPLLVNLSINDIFGAVKNGGPVSLDDTNFFNALMYADDLIIMATSKEELQNSLENKIIFSWMEFLFAKSWK